MPGDWSPMDPRQQETHRLLALVGGEPAAFFLDACRLMGNEPRLEAASHLVAHLLRELNAALRDVLRPMVADEDWPAVGSDNAQVRQVNAICDALGVSADAPLRVLWREVVHPLAGLAHRYSRAAPRPVDDEFRELWEKAQVVFRELAGRIEANYTLALALVDRLATDPPDINRFRQQVPHSTVVLDRFFERVTLEWFEPLREAGYFEAPPPLAYDEDGSVSYVRWPQSRYLVRAATSNPDAVIEIGNALSTDNPEAHEAVVDAALALPPEQSVQLVPRVEEWLKTPEQWALPYKAQDLVVHLVRGDRIDEGLGLLRALAASDHLQRNRSAVVGHMLEELTPQIFPAADLGGIVLFVEFLRNEIAAGATGNEDFSSIWRPQIARERHRDMRDVLVSALRDGAHTVVDAHPELLADVIGALEAGDSSIFRRLSLYLLAVAPDRDMIAARLADPELLLDGNARHEYDELARRHFGSLTGDAIERLYGVIESGPTFGTDDPDFVARWRLDMLRRFPSPLPDAWQQQVDDLTKTYGQPPEAPGVSEVGFVGPNSPLSLNEVAEMTVDEIVSYASSWRASDDGWQAPSREGLGRVLQQAVVADPIRFADSAIAFADLDPTYVRAVLGGLREARTKEKSFPWPAVLELGVDILGRDRDIAGRDGPGMTGSDPGWGWTWQELGHLVAGGLQSEEIEHDQRDRVWAIASQLAEDEHPAADDRAGDGGGEAPSAAMLALNSVRGAGVELLLSYGLWLRGRAAPSPDSHLPEEAKTLLERRLDPDVERTLAIHSLYGKWFPRLVFAEANWARAQVARIFPPDDERRRRVAFSSYVSFNGVWQATFPLLRAEYELAIEALHADEIKPEPFLGDPDEALVNHITTAFQHGLIDLADGGLLDRFYACAPLEKRASAIDSLGRNLMGDTEFTDEMLTRLQQLWEQRMAAVADSTDEDAAEEVRGFAWWFASGKLEQTWSLQQLDRVINAGGRLDPDHVVAERLAACDDEHLQPAIRSLELLIDSPTRRWFVFGAREAIRTLLGRGLVAGGRSEVTARDIVNRLVARGHAEYQELLES